MIKHIDIADAALRKSIRRKEIMFAGNSVLKIYGRLQCRSGKRMKRANRVLFSSEQEAIALGFRPCGHCMQQQYKDWENGSVQ